MQNLDLDAYTGGMPSAFYRLKEAADTLNTRIPLLRDLMARQDGERAQKTERIIKGLGDIVRIANTVCTPVFTRQLNLLQLADATRGAETSYRAIMDGIGFADGYLDGTYTPPDRPDAGGQESPYEEFMFACALLGLRTNF